MTSKILVGMRDTLKSIEPDIVLIHGDTTTTFATSLACFYMGIKVAHVEAGQEPMTSMLLFLRNTTDEVLAF